VGRLRKARNEAEEGKGVRQGRREINECDDSGPRNADSVPNFVGFGPIVDRNLREKGRLWAAYGPCEVGIATNCYTQDL
jgi:hypothetical protein